MDFSGPKTEENLAKIAKDVGLDVKKLKKAKDDPALQDKLDKISEYARSVGIAGTPGFLFNEKINPGYLDAGQMKEIVKELRESKGE